MNLRNTCYLNAVLQVAALAAPAVMTVCAARALSHPCSRPLCTQHADA